MSELSAEEKRKLRRESFSALRGLPDSEKAAASEKLREIVGRLPAYRDAGTVFSFLPLSSEPDLTPLISPEKRWAFPRVLADDESMEFRFVNEPLSQSVVGGNKIREPDPEICPIADAAEADLILVPGVAFCEETGHRLGRGKGHYDRFLARGKDRDCQPLLAGVCFSVQLRQNVPAEEHDVPMDLVVSG